MKILILGSGGREHALAHTFFRQGHRVYCLPGNAGTDEICDAIPKQWGAINATHHNQITDLVKKLGVDLTVVGPENLLEGGIADAFAVQHLPLFGPTKKATTLESSKAWSKQFMAKYQIPTARFSLSKNLKEAHELANKNFTEWNGVVIKPSGLTGGKGVAVCQTLEEASDAIKEIMEENLYGKAGEEIVIEERLIGKELSILAFCDGEKMIPMIPSQDHKRLYNNDKGPNTGGVGAYAPPPFADKLMTEIKETIIDRTNEGLKREGIIYKGVLFFGIILTASGPKLLEYNCRFGDPEAQAVLPLLGSDLARIMRSCLDGKLQDKDIIWSAKVSCCVVMVSGGYPNRFVTGQEIFGLNDLKGQRNCLVFHAGTVRNEGNHVVTSGGRVLGITGIGNTLQEAIDMAYDGVKKISFNQAYYRTDIAHQAFIEERSKPK